MEDIVEGEGTYRGKEETTNVSSVLVASFAFSHNFFSTNIKKWLKMLGVMEKNLDSLTSHLGEINEKIDLMSDIYRDIYSVFCKPEENSITNKKEQFTVFNGGIWKGIETIINQGLIGTSETKTETLLLIKGPIGSYKNRLLQYIYLHNIAIAYRNRNVDMPMFYIDFKSFESNNQEFYDNKIARICEICHNKTSLFILDNIRNFDCKMRPTYENFNDNILEGTTCKIIMGVDNAFTTNTNRKCNWYKSYSRDRDKYKPKYQINITSLNLNRRDKCKIFIKNCINFFKDKDNENTFTPQTEKAVEKAIDNFYNWLISEQLFAVDAFQITELLGEIKFESDGRIENAPHIVDIYSKKYSQNIKNVSDLSEEVFNFEHSKCDISFNNNNWQHVKHHKSVLDYFAAKYYDDVLTEAFNAVNPEAIPNLITPKFLTRFISTDTYDHVNLVECAKKIFGIKDGEANFSIEGSNYIQLSQWAYFLGRTTKPYSSLGSAEDLKKEDRSKILYKALKIAKISDNDSNELKMRKLLVLRSIYVSLIYRKDIDALNAYCLNLINEDPTEKGYAENTWNGLNSGFHLDYYGDITNPHIIGHKVEYKDLEGKDGEWKGTNTFRKLSIDLRRYFFAPTENSPYLCVLQLVTYCKLLEVRGFYFEKVSTDENFAKDLLSFLNTLLEKYIAQDESYRDLNIIIISYFTSCRDKLIIKINEQENCELYQSVFSKLPLQVRKGWVDRGISKPESVADHVYNCWVLAFQNLPPSLKGFDKYNKQTVLNLVLLHDMGESVTGDKASYEKRPEDRENEQKYVDKFLDSCIDMEVRCYKKQIEELITQKSESPGSDNAQDAGAVGKDINLQIAKEVDHLQGANQYFAYFMDRNTNGLRYLSIPQPKQDERVVVNDAQVNDKIINYNIDEWLKSIDDEEITTEIGHSIRDRLILQNEWFKSDLILKKRFEEFLKNSNKVKLD